MADSPFSPEVPSPELPKNTTHPGVVPRDEQCRVNAAMSDLWAEDGMSRWRTVFSAEGTPASDY